MQIEWLCEFVRAQGREFPVLRSSQNQRRIWSKTGFKPAGGEDRVVGIAVRSA
jgi:hypothetical protein